MGSQSRYFVKYRVIGHKEGHFWTEYRVWDITDKSLRVIMDNCIDQCKQDASKLLSKKLKDEDIDILSFNLVEAITKIEI